MKKTWMPTVAGILDIVAGGLSLSVLLLFAVGPMIIMPLNEGTFSLNWSLFLMVIPGLAIEALAIVGGVFAIQRRKWRWALAGSIAAFFPSWPLGIAAIVLTILSKNEFE
ncbi:MAG: hypothetical protein H8D32_06625 [Dehalococcoidia bacterium]|nr:hypothetical protein [Dehalococcoidia bacterium]